MFNPGDIRNPTVTPEYFSYSAQTKGYETDFNNFAPNVGVAWRPNVQNGFMRTFLGDPEIATINAGYTRSFNRERLDSFLNIYNGNPGQTIPATRKHGPRARFRWCCLARSWPLLYQQTGRLGPPAFNADAAFPISASFASELPWIFQSPTSKCR
jgi:hypothetical protein